MSRNKCVAEICKTNNRKVANYLLQDAAIQKIGPHPLGPHIWHGRHRSRQAIGRHP